VIIVLSQGLIRGSSFRDSAKRAPPPSAFSPRRRVSRYALASEGWMMYAWLLTWLLEESSIRE